MKEDYQIGFHRLLRNAVIHLSFVEFLQLKLNTESVHPFLKLIRNHLKYPIETTDERQQHQISEISAAS